jgi:urease accessory protein
MTGATAAGPPEAGAGWQASLELGFVPRAGRSVLAERRRQGPLAVQRAFYPEGEVAHCYLLHPPGGVVGGDSLAVRVRVDPGAHALITAPGAAKLYRSAGPAADIAQELRVAAGGTLEWLPPETILFQGARARVSTRVRLETGARFLGWELQCLGRPAVGERFRRGSADLALSIERDGRPLLLERLRIDDGDGLDGPAGLRGHAVVATLVATDTDAAALAALREALPEPEGLLWGATRLGDLLVLRILAGYAEPAQRLLRAAWGILRPRVLDREACPPRIWRT